MPRFVFDYPQDTDETLQPLFSGKVLISSTAGEELSIPYFGAAFNLKKEYNAVFQKGSVFARSPTYDIFQKSK